MAAEERNVAALQADLMTFTSGDTMVNVDYIGVTVNELDESYHCVMGEI